MTSSLTFLCLIFLTYEMENDDILLTFTKNKSFPMSEVLRISVSISYTTNSRILEIQLLILEVRLGHTYLGFTYYFADLKAEA